MSNATEGPEIDAVINRQFTVVDLVVGLIVFWHIFLPGVPGVDVVALSGGDD